MNTTPASKAQPASRLTWTKNQPYRVHYYDPLRAGTWHRYFDNYQSARDFAQGCRLHARPCEVEQRPV